MNKKDLKAFNFLVLCIILLGITSALQQIHITFVASPKHGKPATSFVPQFVLVSFDGSRSVEIWKTLRLFKDKMKAAGKSLNYTHFINAAYFLTDDTRIMYKGPGQEPGKSNVGFSEDINNLRTRIREVNRAVDDGDEIAVHTVGHFSGLLWGKEEWKDELGSFDSVLFNLENIYPKDSLLKLHLKKSDVIGFRAPYLDHGPGLYEALHELPAYRYDTTEIGKGNEWPTKDAQGLWHIPLGMLELGESRLSILAMDYNLYAHDSQAHDEVRKGTAQWQKIYEETLAAFIAYFEQNYKGNHAPVLVGYHFEMWNDEVYWEALKAFAHEVCGKPEVKCGTFRELVDYLDKNGVPKK